MNIEEIQKKVYGDSEKARVNEILKQLEERYHTRNMFRPNAGPPDEVPELIRRAMRIRDERLKVNVTETKADVEEQVVAVPEIKKPLELRVQPEVKIAERETKYRKGDNIFSEVIDYFESGAVGKKEVKPVLEERANCILSLVAMLSRISVIIEGKSRSGKSLIMDKCLELLPSYVSLISGSEKSFIDRIDEINAAGAVYIHEFQETVFGNDYLTAAVKHLSEGKDWVYKRSGEELSALSGRTIVCSTGADENKKVQKTDVELLARFIRLRTRDDEEKNTRICEQQDLLDAGLSKKSSFSEKRLEALKSHVSSIINGSSCFENPFAVYFGKEYLPATQKSVHYRTLYSSLIKSFARFDSPNRIFKEEKTQLVNLGDVYLAYAMYHKTYCDVLENLASKSFEALSKNTATSEIDLAREKEKCEKEIAMIKEKRDKPLNWQELWNNGYDLVKQNCPEILDEWVNSQSKNDKVVVYDPVERRDVYLCDTMPLKLEVKNEKP